MLKCIQNRHKCYNFALLQQGDEIMEDIVLYTENIGKDYGSFSALTNLNLCIKRGSMYGLIGKNGAGKTTLLKIISGLAEQSSGKIFIMGSDNDCDIKSYRKNIGCTIESPALYPNMSVEDNIKIQQIQKNGFINKQELLNILKLINLQDKSRKLVWSLSYGMKQRLAIGVSLVDQPSFLILDEPINGLDPLGIKELRDLLKRLNGEFGTTILISSHLLSELEQIITDYGILHNGKLIEQGSISDLNQKEFKYIKIISPDITELKYFLESNKRNYSQQRNEFRIYENCEGIPILCKKLISMNIEIEEIRTVSEGLEEYFMRIIKEEPDV